MPFYFSLRLIDLPFSFPRLFSVLPCPPFPLLLLLLLLLWLNGVMAKGEGGDAKQRKTADGGGKQTEMGEEGRKERKKEGREKRTRENQIEDKGNAGDAFPPFLFFSPSVTLII